MKEEKKPRIPEKDLKILKQINSMQQELLTALASGDNATASRILSFLEANISIANKYGISGIDLLIKQAQSFKTFQSSSPLEGIASFESNAKNFQELNANLSILAKTIKEQALDKKLDALLEIAESREIESKDLTQIFTPESASLLKATFELLSPISKEISQDRQEIEDLELKVKSSKDLQEKESIDAAIALKNKNLKKKITTLHSNPDFQTVSDFTKKATALETRSSKQAQEEFRANFQQISALSELISSQINVVIQSGRAEDVAQSLTKAHQVESSLGQLKPNPTPVKAEKSKVKSASKLV